MTAATQTLTSEYGREPLTVAAEIPTVMLRHKLGSTYVGESDDAVTAMVAEAVDRQGTYTAEQRAETIAAALWLHHENRAEYAAVTSGRF